ncbi:MAG: hypothetical protein KF781_01220 [Chitinophagaceae bacterium]|nr:hypothetical protein [Chitinophagaceae bacterium]MCW5905356.1 hypothetical protein [Chitinophagaceae bacterium]
MKFPINKMISHKDCKPICVHYQTEDELLLTIEELKHNVKRLRDDVDCSDKDIRGLSKEVYQKKRWWKF